LWTVRIMRAHDGGAFDFGQMCPRGSCGRMSHGRSDAGMGQGDFPPTAFQVFNRNGGIRNRGGLRRAVRWGPGKSRFSHTLTVHAAWLADEPQEGVTALPASAAGAVVPVAVASVHGAMAAPVGAGIAAAA
jgi:hypothetical protein